MTLSVLGIIGTLLGVVFFIWKRQAAKHDNPEFQNEKRKSEISREVISRDGESANRSLDDDLNRLHSLQSDQRGKGSSTDASQ